MTDPTSARYRRLPSEVDPSQYVVEIPSFVDDRPEAAAPPPAAAPELVAATQLAEGYGGRRTIRRTQVRTGLWLAGVPIVCLVAIAVVQIVLAG
ncbi:hypothetical protein ACPEEZ_05410 [Frigoribacterium sp. 2-23]|uniref:hypothetical protein n=1 Tax=Frigoribacterium sp. 2-23 TaxID=3415006 RepID=UPI003C6EB342